MAKSSEGDRNGLQRAWIAVLQSKSFTPDVYHSRASDCFQSALISKSKSLMGSQRRNLLSVVYNHKDRVPETDAATEAIFDQGHEDGALAKSLCRPTSLADGSNTSGNWVSNTCRPSNGRMEPCSSF
jgi:hypothetical protein